MLVTRYVKLVECDVRINFKDIKAANIYQRALKGRNESGIPINYGYYCIYVCLEDDTLFYVDLPGMLWFERDMLQRSLDKIGLPEQQLWR